MQGVIYLIRIIGREMRIPKNEESVGFVGDNKTEIREFEITDKTLFDFDFKLDLKVKSHIGVADLEKNTESEKIILKWQIEKSHLPEKGIIFAQLRAFKATEEAWHSEKGQFWVSEGINATEYFPAPLPNEFEQMEQRVTAAKNETVSAQNAVTGKADEVAANMQIILEKTDTVLQKAAEVKTNAEATAQNTDTAQNSANIAAQSLADLLNMIGTDIATLTNGKLTASQIPSIAITNTFICGSEAEMLTINAQTGDVCIRTDESKSYILQNENAAFSENWKYLQSPTNYADTAGYATQADYAENALRVNGHRVVYMTAEQYEAAVKDPDTIYMVGVE